MLMMLFFSGGVMGAFFYLYFVAAALVMDICLCIWPSPRAYGSAQNFWSTLALIG